MTFFYFPGARLQSQALYVSRGIDDNILPPDGSMGRPFRSLAAALSYASNTILIPASIPVAIIVEPGNYPDAISLTRSDLYIVGLVHTRVAVTRLGPITLSAQGRYGLENVQISSNTTVPLVIESNCELVSNNVSCSTENDALPAMTVNAGAVVSVSDTHLSGRAPPVQVAEDASFTATDTTITAAQNTVLAAGARAAVNLVNLSTVTPQTPVVEGRGATVTVSGDPLRPIRITT